MSKLLGCIDKAESMLAARRGRRVGKGEKRAGCFKGRLEKVKDEKLCLKDGKMITITCTVRERAIATSLAEALSLP